MSRRRRIGSAMVGVWVLGGVIGAPGAGSAQPEPCHDPADAGYASYQCKVTRLRERSFVVVAVPDTGINPYHMDFRLPPDNDMVGVPPWEYISGYPKTAEALDLSLDATSYQEALERDDDTWDAVDTEHLYYIPGTKIIGAYAEPSAWSPPILDEYGHGTPVASVAAGLIHGSAPDPDVLLVSIERGDETITWAAAQPWIDVVSGSFGAVGGLYYLGTNEDEVSQDAVERGKVVVFAAGNGASGTALACDRNTMLMSRIAGPPWIISVGAVSPRSGQSYCWNSIPPDVSSYGLHWPAADHRSLGGQREFGGTSNAAPLTAGVIAAQILEARRLFGDTDEGPHGEAALALAGDGSTIPSQGPLSDGALTNLEVRETTEKTALPEEFTVEGLQEDLKDCPDNPSQENCLLYTQNLTTPTTAAYYVYQGYGIVNKASRDRAIAVLKGEQPLPDRSDVDEWMEVRRTVSDLLWDVLLAND